MGTNSITGLKEFNHHKLVISIPDELGNLIGFIAIHRGSHVVPAFGATRIWNYSSEKDALNDALRLSRLMSYKAAMAGLPYGGAKAVLFNGLKDPVKRDKIIREYAKKVNYLRGAFITGADVGINEKDLNGMADESKYIVGLSIDPVRFTVLGVYYAIQECLKEVFGNESIKQRSFAIQGLGKTGYALLKLLYKEASTIYVTDLDPKKLAIAKEKFPKIVIVQPTEIFTVEADVYSPCALGNVINEKNVSSLKCKIIAGSANNQLETSEVGNILYKSGILYAPDYVINAGGLIAVVDEYENPRVSIKRISQRVEGIKKRMKLIIAESKKKKRSTSAVADEIAESIFNNFI